MYPISSAVTLAVFGGIWLIILGTMQIYAGSSGCLQAAGGLARTSREPPSGACRDRRPRNPGDAISFRPVAAVRRPRRAWYPVRSGVAQW